MLVLCNIVQWICRVGIVCLLAKSLCSLSPGISSLSTSPFSGAQFFMSYFPYVLTLDYSFPPKAYLYVFVVSQN